jgi:hypothetical protein
MNIFPAIHCYWQLTSGLWRRVVMWWDTNVSEDHAASILTASQPKDHDHTRCNMMRTQPDIFALFYTALKQFRRTKALQGGSFLEAVKKSFVSDTKYSVCNVLKSFCDTQFECCFVNDLCKITLRISTGDLWACHCLYDDINSKSERYSG